jgi:hypothetical protein
VTLSNDWTTTVLPEFTAPYGVEEVHNIWLTPKGWLGQGPAVSLLIPECEMHLVILATNSEPVAFVNRSQNKNIKGWIRSACKIVKDHGAAISFACDTHEQAEMAAKIASKLLPKHERIALERMYEAKTRARSNLS